MEKICSLSDLNVLVLDIQATGANPGYGFPTEFGWREFCVSGGTEDAVEAIESYFCQLPEGEEVPRRVSRITGINTMDLELGLPVRQVWSKLLEGVDKIISGRNEVCPTVIHFSRYEETFLRYFHQQFSPDMHFPFDIICTHHLARRLLPGLPRKSLRAIAGYFGHSVPELRRSAHHVAATAFIWKRLVALLEEKGIDSLEQLKEWFQSPIPKISSPNWEYLVESALRLNLPKKPGVYRMLRSNGDLLYIGKATSLKHRVNSYFQKKKKSCFSKNTLEMLTQAARLDVMITGSALEAALFETDEIKRFSPPYNTALRIWNREVVFFSRDFRSVSSTVDEFHSVGPLPNHTIPAFASLVALLRDELTGEEKEICSKVMGIHQDYIPDFQCFQEGLEEFRLRHSDRLRDCGQVGLIRNLMVLGKGLHQKMLEDLALKDSAVASEDGITEDDEIESVPSEGESAEKIWTPESVANMLEYIIRQSAHLIRRSRWYCILSESTLVWFTGKTTGGQRRLLLLENGAIAGQDDLDPKVQIPVPYGFKKNFSDRRICFDLMTYDRMRVLTTELRRLITDKTDRNLQVCLRPGVILEHPQLEILLKWV